MPHSQCSTGNCTGPHASYLGGMHPRKASDARQDAANSVTESLAARARAMASREGWRIWREQWATMEGEPPDERLLAVCMYCERFRAHTGEWAAPPPGLTAMLHDPKVMQITHSICAKCLARRFGED
jgi:hypothetical protein